MARRSDYSGKGPRAGQRRSHSMHATKRWFKPNIVQKWLDLEVVKAIFELSDREYIQLKMAGYDKLRVKLTAKEYKTFRKKGVI